MRFFIYILLLISLVSCERKNPVTVGGIQVPVELLVNADDQRFDYTGKLAKALQKDSNALEELFRFTQKTDTETAMLHGRVLLALLNAAGDDFFAKTISAETPEIQQVIWAALDNCAPPASKLALKTVAPLTFRTFLPEKEPLAYQGLYNTVNKVSTFFECGPPAAKYVAIHETDGIDQQYKQLLRFPYPGQPVYARVKGYKTGYYGAAVLPDNYAGFFVIKEIIEMKVKNFRNTCIPYDLWALGTEPFWQAQISAAEGIIEFQEMGVERFKVFGFVPPVEDDSSKVYAAINEDTGDNIRIAISQEPCGDGMSARSYSFKVALTVNGKNFSGCGFPFEAGKESEQE